MQSRGAFPTLGRHLNRVGPTTEHPAMSSATSLAHERLRSPTARRAGLLIDRAGATNRRQAGTITAPALYGRMSCSGKILVLLVEDEPLIQVVAAEGLEDAGYEVIEAVNAADALALISSRHDVGVLFTDVNMPGSLDGLTLAEMIHARWPDVRLVITSGRPLERAVPDAGAFLRKPYSLDQLTRAIRSVGGDTKSGVEPLAT
jgi:CheY-like chemotaxis protein